MDHLLSIIVFLPLAGALLLVLLDRGKEGLVKTLALAVSTVGFLISLLLYFRFQPDTSQMQFVEKVPWVHLDPADPDQ